MDPRDFHPTYAEDLRRHEAGVADVAEAAPVVVDAPPRGAVCRVTVYDSYADPPRDRDQLVIVTGEPDPTGAVPGFVLGYAEAVEASFRPEQLRPA